MRRTCRRAPRPCAISTSSVYLVDTNVISAGAPTKSTALHYLPDWMDRNSAMLFLSVVTIAEITDGIAKSRRQGATRKADRLDSWLETIRYLYADRILPIDVAVAIEAGARSDLARGSGHDPGFADILIGATAVHHRLQVLTMNLRHFRVLEVDARNPFAEPYLT